MKYRSLLIFISLLFYCAAGAQQPAVKPAVADSLPPPADSIQRGKAVNDSTAAADVAKGDSTLFNIVYDGGLAARKGHWMVTERPFSVKALPVDFMWKPVTAAPVIVEIPRQVNGKEYLFYLLLLLLVVFAVLRMVFPKYFSDMVRLFFRTTLKQKQLRDQLMQTPLASLLFNAFFVLSGGLYISFVASYFSIDPLQNFWLTFLYACLGLAACYFVKYAGLKICGWLFSMDESADAYIFIVFIINKMAGILLLPLLPFLAFSDEKLRSGAFVFSWILLGGLVLYRFILTYGALRNQVRLNLFHFFLYICAFEIAPLLLVYKALLIFFNQTT